MVDNTAFLQKSRFMQGHTHIHLFEWWCKETGQKRILPPFHTWVIITPTNTVVLGCQPRQGSVRDAQKI